jgi:copper transport protein
MVVLGLWPGGLRDARTRRLIWSGLGMLSASALGSVTVHATWVNGLPLAEAWTGSQGDQLVGLSDYAYAARFYCLLALGVVMGIATAVGRSLGRPLTVGAWVISAMLLATWPLAGHAVTGRQVPLAIAADLLHLAAMTTWLGGLVLVAVTLSRPAMAAELATMLPRFSRLAFTCVLVLVVTGTYQAWRELGSVSVLVGTPLGRLLLIKTACVVLLVALGGLARRWIQRTLMPVTLRKQEVPVGDMVVLAREVLPDSVQLRAFRRGLVAELGIGVVVLGVTAVLVATSPAV